MTPVASTGCTAVHFWCIALAPCLWFDRRGTTGAWTRFGFNLKSGDSHEIAGISVDYATLTNTNKGDQAL
jgi:hypothetical protein